CEVTAIDINPVAWFILKCTLEYPWRLAGQRRPLPTFALQSPSFVAEYQKGRSRGGPRARRPQGTQAALPLGEDADLAWHVRAWGHWVLERARADLERFYPTIGGQPTVAYLWARTVECKACRATLPLLKTRWLCRKEKKRVLLTMQPNADRTGVVFGVQSDVPRVPGSAAERGEHDRRLGAGTMSRSGATCPCCGAIMTMEDIRFRGRAGQLGAVMTAVVVQGERGKQYRLPTAEELRAAQEAEGHVAAVFADIPFGLPDEPLPPKEALGIRVPLYGLDCWHKLFTPRQLLLLGSLVRHTRAAREAMRERGYSQEWRHAIE
ncbi:MAG: hypothetical protein QME94_14580, partial [Anaerolineae bacterium]|nr:hypothetical protein [Anaerolineae bacterium]